MESIHVIVHYLEEAILQNSTLFLFDLYTINRWIDVYFIDYFIAKFINLIHPIINTVF